MAVCWRQLHDKSLNNLNLGWYLWRDDIEEVSSQSVLLSKDVVVVCLEGNAEHVDDEGTGGQVQRNAVLP